MGRKDDDYEAQLLAQLAAHRKNGNNINSSSSNERSSMSDSIATGDSDANHGLFDQGSVATSVDMGDNATYESGPFNNEEHGRGKGKGKDKGSDRDSSRRRSTNDNDRSSSRQKSSGNQRRESGGSRRRTYFSESEESSHSTMSSYHRPRNRDKSSSSSRPGSEVRGGRDSKNRNGNGKLHGSSSKNKPKSSCCDGILRPLSSLFDGVHFKTLLLSLMLSIAGTATMIRMVHPALFNFVATHGDALNEVRRLETSVDKPPGVRGAAVAGDALAGEEGSQGAVDESELMHMREEMGGEDEENMEEAKPEEVELTPLQKSMARLEAEALAKEQEDLLNQQQQQQATTAGAGDPNHQAATSDLQYQLMQQLQQTQKGTASLDQQQQLMQLEKQLKQLENTPHKQGNTGDGGSPGMAPQNGVDGQSNISPQEAQLLELQNQLMQSQQQQQQGGDVRFNPDEKQDSSSNQGSTDQVAELQQQHMAQQNRVTDLKSQLMQLQQTRIDGEVDEAPQELVDRLRDASDEAAELQNKLMELQKGQGDGGGGSGEQQQQQQQLGNDQQYNNQDKGGGNQNVDPMGQQQQLQGGADQQGLSQEDQLKQLMLQLQQQQGLASGQEQQQSQQGFDNQLPQQLSQQSITSPQEQLSKQGLDYPSNNQASSNNDNGQQQQQQSGNSYYLN